MGEEIADEGGVPAPMEINLTGKVIELPSQGNVGFAQLSLGRMDETNVEGHGM